MDELYNLLGKSLYEKVIVKLNGKKIFLCDGKFIPKYRLDEVSKELKEQREICTNLRSVLDAQEAEYLENINKIKIFSLIYPIIAKSRPKNFDVILKLIKKEGLSLSNVESSINYQLRKIKKEFPQLFFSKTNQ